MTHLVDELKAKADANIAAMRDAALRARDTHARAELMRHMLMTADKVKDRPGPTRCASSWITGWRHGISPARPGRTWRKWKPLPRRFTRTRLAPSDAHDDAVRATCIRLELRLCRGRDAHRRPDGVALDLRTWLVGAGASCPTGKGPPGSRLAGAAVLGGWLLAGLPLAQLLSAHPTGRAPRLEFGGHHDDENRQDRILADRDPGNGAVVDRAPARAQVEIEYWQYTFAQRVTAIDTLIKQFEAANPGIKVKHTHVPYDDFRVKIAAAIPAGQGPDVVQLFYGWLQDYLKAGLLQPLPANAFSVAEVEREFFPIVQQMKVDGKVLRAAHRGALAGALLEQDAVQGSRTRPRAATRDARGARRLRSEADKAQPQRRSAAGRPHHRHGRSGSSLAARGADPPVRRHALFGRQEEPSPTTRTQVLPRRSGTSISPPRTRWGRSAS